MSYRVGIEFGPFRSDVNDTRIDEVECCVTHFDLLQLYIDSRTKTT